MDKVLIGEIGVDSGLCWLGDPRYCVVPDASEHPARTWAGFCKKLAALEQDGASQWTYKKGHAGLGVCVSTGWGDGVYPVYASYDRGTGRIAKVEVIFIPEEDDGR